ncbi:MAG: tetratricopeptide repeat protein [Balneolaceae bacterium]
MKRSLQLLLISLFFWSGCDLIDGTQVRNPDLTLDVASQQPQSGESWLNGLNQRLAYVYNNFLVTSELSTDNYVNEGSFFNSSVDNGLFPDTNGDFDDAQKAIARLREQAVYGLEVILPEHDTEAAGTETEAEMHFYKGWSHLLAGELFTALPAEPDGPAVSPDTHFQRAAEAFGRANQMAPSVSYELALARVYYNLGDRDQAVTYAQSVLDQSPDFLRLQEYDAVNNPSNLMQDAVYDRQSFNDLQPLPRLDFLDPKYGDLGGTNESPVVLQSAEEAHLILAEAALSEEDLPGAQTALQNLLDLVEDRPVREFNETEEPRQGASGEAQRPNSSDYRVRADDSSPWKEGLVLDRTAITPVPTVSGTSVTESEINSLAAPGFDALELLYLMRQEVFFGEGRRMADLGVKWPVSETEALNNENITQEDRTAHIPSWMPGTYSSINEYTVDGEDITITVNLNRLIAMERGNRFE